MDIIEKVEHLLSVIAMLAGALAEHKHEWTEYERAAYDEIDFDLPLRLAIVLEMQSTIKNLASRVDKLEAEDRRDKMHLIMGNCDLGGKR
jgi:hypothetical protein